LLFDVFRRGSQKSHALIDRFFTGALRSVSRHIVS
jgi:hypothetical protein